MSNAQIFLTLPLFFFTCRQVYSLIRIGSSVRLTAKNIQHRTVFNPKNGSRDLSEKQPKLNTGATPPRDSGVLHLRFPDRPAAPCRSSTAPGRDPRTQRGRSR